jgi:MarR family transcriptional regulator, organic hydroperoxide resistance regulator
VDPLYEFSLSVKAIQRELDRQTNQVMEPLGLTAAQADALYILGKAAPLSLKELGELLIAEAGHPSRLVDRLVQAGLIERKPAEEDRRRIVLSLTPKGRRLEEKILAAREGIFQLARELLGERDLTPTLEVLRDLVEFTSYRELLARRRELEDQTAGEGKRSGRASAAL